MRLFAGLVVASLLSLTGLALAEDAATSAVSERGYQSEVAVATADDAGEEKNGKSAEEGSGEKSESGSAAKSERKAKKSAGGCSSRRTTGTRLSKRC